MFWPVQRILANSMARARPVQTPILHPKIGSKGRTGMGLESGWAHALGCPEWGPPGAGPQEGHGVLGSQWGRGGGFRAAVA
jgi:hypothetical protein